MIGYELIHTVLFYRLRKRNCWLNILYSLWLNHLYLFIAYSTLALQ